ncbi:MAG: 4'-phosphopantetheinyl transferase superfamily protein [Mariniphaga sp.]|nr:4'-phosphopantetheinyl transferase superfamily protein [Mariniphaga sp.]
MPAIKIFDIENGKMGIWKFQESSEKLQQIFRFSEKEKKEFQSIKYENRKKEFLTIRLLLAHMLGEKTEILYSESGKPQLKNNPFFISISHSADLAVVLLSEKNAGVDVENVHRNTEKIATRFLSEDELNEINNSQKPQLLRILYWCAKEAAFKFSVWSEIEFKSQINIHKFELNAECGIFFGLLSKKLPHTNLTFHYFFFENNVIVYCVEVEKS